MCVLVLGGVGGLTGVRSRCSEPLWSEGILGCCHGNNSESAHKHTQTWDVSLGVRSLTRHRDVSLAVRSLTHHRVGSHRHPGAVGQVVEDVGRFGKQVAEETQTSNVTPVTLCLRYVRGHPVNGRLTGSSPGPAGRDVLPPPVHTAACRGDRPGDRQEERVKHMELQSPWRPGPGLHQTRILCYIDLQHKKMEAFAAEEFFSKEHKRSHRKCQ